MEAFLKFMLFAYLSLHIFKKVSLEPALQMYFPLVFEVIRRTCFALTPATPFIVPSTLLLVGF